MTSKKEAIQAIRQCNNNHAAAVKVIVEYMEAKKAKKYPASYLQEKFLLLRREFPVHGEFYRGVFQQAAAQLNIPYIDSNTAPTTSTSANAIAFPLPELPPPSYTDTMRGALLTTTATTTSMEEDEFDYLRDYDTVFLIDDSGSMSYENRWKEAEAALSSVVEIATRYDQDGVDVHFLNDRNVGRGISNAGQVMRIFQSVTPNRGTPTAKRMEDLLRDYWKSYKSTNGQVKPLNLIIITDGEPSDDPESVIVKYAKLLDAADAPLNQIGIQFFQIGNDPRATASLQELDDELKSKYQIRDIVDTIPYNGQALTGKAILKALMGGINRRLDKLYFSPSFFEQQQSL